MIYYENGWHLCSEKVRYTQHGEELIQYVMSEGHEWWVDFEEKWEHTEIIEFIPVAATDVQLERYNEILELNIGEGHSAELSNYVESGEFPEGINHPLWGLQLRKENEELKQVINALLGVEA